MWTNKILTAVLLVLACCISLDAREARWITADAPDVNNPNTWITFRKDVTLKHKPKSAILDIAADSKYWLWINGEPAVFEGQLKRGPERDASYYDHIDIAPYLKKGENRIAVLLWHFGKQGFSHVNSGRSGLIVRSDATPALNTDSTWVSRVYDAYGTMGEPLPNYRLPESSISYDASREMPGWQNAPVAKLGNFTPSAEIGSWGDMPWGKMMRRPIPMWKDYGLKTLEFVRKDAGDGRDSIIAKLPTNIQMTPWFDIDDPRGGSRVIIETDHFLLNEYNLRAEYITRQGRQSYESLGWLPGEHLYLILPKDVKVNALGFRETGYDTGVAGGFHSSDPFFNRFWDKAMRTIYVNMRDTWFDCPERERAQWWGDVTVIMGEVFYSYSHTAHDLLRKGILELAAWQKPDGSLFSPIPAGNYDSELPTQMLSAIGRYGFWHYYFNTGDRATIAAVYPAVKKYLSLYTTDPDGLTTYRIAGWNWGDWGDNKDMRLLQAAWHYIALDGAARMADMLGETGDAAAYRSVMADVKRGFNRCWNGYAYRHPAYNDATDDRVQALAVVSGLADTDKYPALTQLLESQRHASPYMEKYVMEALFKMGEGTKATRRIRERFKDMIENPYHDTLFEGWVIGGLIYGGGTVNHAWSGGPVTVLGQYLCGVTPLEAAWKSFAVDPSPADISEADITVPSVAGDIRSAYRMTDTEFSLDVTVPRGTTGYIYLPAANASQITAADNLKVDRHLVTDSAMQRQERLCLRLTPGDYSFTVSRR